MNECKLLYFFMNEVRPIINAIKIKRLRVRAVLEKTWNSLFAFESELKHILFIIESNFPSFKINYICVKLPNAQ